MKTAASTWTPDSWRAKPAQQMPAFEDLKRLADVEYQLAGFRPLVFARRGKKAQAQARPGLRRQGFPAPGRRLRRELREHSADNIRDFFRVFLQMAVVLTFAGSQPVVKVGRIAGQFAKPRSAPFETVNGEELPIYRGDIVNDAAPVLAGRKPDPERQTMAYRQSAATLNLLRAFAQGGYANLEHVHKWTLGFLRICPPGRATTRSPTASPRRWALCAPAASIPTPRRNCARPISLRATRHCCSAMSRP